MDARRVKVMLGNWYSGYDDERYCYEEAFRYISEINDALEVVTVDEWGREVDDEGNLIHPEEGELQEARDFYAEAVDEEGDDEKNEDAEDQKVEEVRTEDSSEPPERKSPDLPEELLEILKDKKKVKPADIEEMEEQMRKLARLMIEKKAAGRDHRRNGLGEEPSF